MDQCQTYSQIPQMHDCDQIYYKIEKDTANCEIIWNFK